MNRDDALGLVRLERWGAGDVELLTALNGDPEMMRHLGGPQTPEQIAERQARYVAPDEPGMGRTLKVIEAGTDADVGWVGYWRHAWQDADVFEIGWSVLASAQGRGLATAAATQAIALARADDASLALHAFPAERNVASNALSRTLGFELIGPCELEFPAGSVMHANDWRLLPNPATGP